MLTCLCQTTMFKRRLPPYWQACSTQVGDSTHNVVPLWQIGRLIAAAHLLLWWCLFAGQQQTQTAAASGSKGDQLPAWDSGMPPSRPALPRALIAETQQAANIGVVFLQVWLPYCWHLSCMSAALLTAGYDAQAPGNAGRQHGEAATTEQPAKRRRGLGNWYASSSWGQGPSVDVGRSKQVG